MHVPRHFHGSWLTSTSLVLVLSSFCHHVLQASWLKSSQGNSGSTSHLSVECWNYRCTHLDFEVFQILKLDCLACTATAIPAEASPQLCSFFRTGSPSEDQASLDLFLLPSSCLGLSAEIIGVCHHFCLDDILLKQGLKPTRPTCLCPECCELKAYVITPNNHLIAYLAFSTTKILQRAHPLLNPCAPLGG